MRGFGRLVVIWAIAAGSLLPLQRAWANGCAVDAGRFVSIDGSVDVQGASDNRWTAARLDRTLCQGDTIRVGERSRAAVALINDAVLRLDQNTTLRLLDIAGREQDRSFLDIVKGAFQSFSRKPKTLAVNTPYLNGSIEGTEFLVRVDDAATTITVFEGVVTAANDRGQVALQPGQSARAAAGEAPQTRILVRPRDEVQWALYYPPILSLADSALASGDLGRAAACAARDDFGCAFATLEQIPPSAHEARFFLVRASTLLAVGRVDEARADLDELLKRDPRSGPGYALRSIIAVVQNEREAALADAQRGVELSPDSATARIALSYAQQSQFQIEAARDTLLATVEAHPEDALAWARLGELWLMLGERGQALAAARKAEALAPELGRTQIVLGFNALAVFRNDEARAAFEQAIQFNSADPLGHLGLGLAKISAGQLADGRRDLEAAVGLDSSNALLRAYLGKAYFEERRYPLDAEQYDIAKDLDPRDPTAFFYSGILKQTVNRPVEAVRDLEQAIALNDNRAVYRSRLLLDQDRAARGTSLARAFNDLGFKQLGLNAATESLTLDPGNASAHRFLSDSYRAAGRFETARVSELQQAQMLQDINLSPIQPSLGETNLNIVTQGGPASAGFNEFTPLFERNRAQANLSFFGGSNDTWGGEAVVSGIYDRFSLSAGAFAYDSNGFRPNNDLGHEIYNLFAQLAITPAINLQAEFQKRDTEYGDLAMNFARDSYSRDLRNKLESDSARLGARFNPSSNSTFLLLYNYKDADFRRSDQALLAPDLYLASDGISKNESNQFEGGYIHQTTSFNLVAGAAYTDVNREDTIDVTIKDPNLGPIPLPPIDQDLDIRDARGYVYGNFEMPASVAWTLGLSYQDYEEDAYTFTRFNPKFGVRWDLTDSLRLRGAYFRVVKPVLASNRTLEPTQVAGFNQFFDDADATRSTRYGGAVDWRANSTVAVGVELTRRELESPVIDQTGAASFEDRDEWLHRAYAYWNPSDRWALSLEAVYDKFANAADSIVADVVPREVTTMSFPLKALYFNPQGYFAGVGVTYVDQEVERTAASTLAQGDSTFMLVDLSVGYRLPRRQGIFSLGVMNLFNEKFDYQDDSYRRFGEEPSVAPYAPERILLGRFTLSF